MIVATSRAAANSASIPSAAVASWSERGGGLAAALITPKSAGSCSLIARTSLASRVLLLHTGNET